MMPLVDEGSGVAEYSVMRDELLDANRSSLRSVRKEIFASILHKELDFSNNMHFFSSRPRLLLFPFLRAVSLRGGCGRLASRR